MYILLLHGCIRNPAACDPTSLSRVQVMLISMRLIVMILRVDRMARRLCHRICEVAKNISLSLLLLVNRHLACVWSLGPPRILAHLLQPLIRCSHRRCDCVSEHLCSCAVDPLSITSPQELRPTGQVQAGRSTSHANLNLSCLGTTATSSDNLPIHQYSTPWQTCSSDYSER